MNEKLKVSVARVLLAFMLNPVAMLGQAWGADTDVYQGFTGSGSSGSGSGSGVVKTNVLLLLDTSDSMNIPEPWKEYDANTYDSHAEYLWNSNTYINTISTNVAAQSGGVWSSTTGRLSTAGSSGSYMNPWGNSTAGDQNQMKYDSGWFSGGTTPASANTEAATLKSAVLAYGHGTNTGNAVHTNPAVTDNGPRYQYRNYAYSNENGWLGSHAYIYWVPLEGRSASSSAIEADPRLRSFSSTKFFGANTLTALGNNNTTSTYPVARGQDETGAQVLFGHPSINWDGLPDMDRRNLCGSSKPVLTPSTVYAPSTHLRNAGKLLGQRWKRWEVYSGQSDTLTSNFPGSSTVVTGGDGATYYRGYLDGARDNYNWPVRLRKYNNAATGNFWISSTPATDNDSFSRWADLKPDYGSQYYDYRVSDYYWNGSRLQELNDLRASLGFTSAKSSMVDATAAFQKEVLRPEYVDTQTSVTVQGTPSRTVYYQRTCNYTGYTWRYDARWYSYATGGSCTDGGVACVGGNSGDCDSTNSTPPACGTPDVLVYDQFYTQYNDGCYIPSGTTQYCSWSGRQSANLLEGSIGDIYHGGSCLLNGTTSSSYCSTSPEYSSYTYAGTTYYNVVRQAGHSASDGCNGSYTGAGGSCTGGYKLTASSPYTSGPSQTYTQSVCNGSCGTIAGSYTTCPAATGQTCYSGCTNKTGSTKTIPGTPPTVYSPVYNTAATGDLNLYHECLEDDGTAYNTSSSYMRAPKASGMANWILGYSDSTDNAYGSYVNSASKGFTASTVPEINLYSVNYLNFKFGAKACRDSSGNLITTTAGLTNAASCKPIARKTRLQVAKDVLTDLVNNLLAANTPVRLGLMAFNQLDSSQGRTHGSYLVKAVQDLTTSSAASLISAINALTASAQTPLTESLYEAYRYYKGQTMMFGGYGSGRDTSSAAMSNSTTYRSPMEETCQANWVILVSDGAPLDDNEANSSILALPTVGGVSIQQSTTSGQLEISAGVPYGPADPTWSSGYVWLDELAQYMSKVDASSTLAGNQYVKLSTISFAGVNAPVLSNAAEVGGGVYYSASDQVQLLQSLTDAVLLAAQWQPQGAPTTVYQPSAGASDSVYVPMYSPNAKVTWDGSVKKFKYGFGESVCGPSSCGNSSVCMIGQTEIDSVCKKNVEVVEYNDQLSLNMVKIRPDAVSFWGTGTDPDGGSGSKGGTGKMLKTGSFTGRVVKTALTTSGSIQNLDVNTANKDLLLTDTTLSAARKEELIHYARGGDGSGSSNWRTWPSFDSVHSRPVVDDNGTPSTMTDDVLYFVTSDGVLHAVNADTGTENWAFMVEEAFPVMGSIRDNASGPHLEVAGGTPVVAKISSTKKLVIFGLRRGGRAYYAINVSGSAPALEWKIANNRFCNASGCQATTSGSAANVNYYELGQAWSTPVVGKIRGVSSPVMVFGGGYDPDADNNGHDTDSYGRALFVANAETGEKIKQFNLRKDLSETGQGYCVPSDPLVLDTNGDAQAAFDRAYIGDLGGQLWRIDLDDRSTSNPTSAWSKVMLAKLKGVRSNNDNFQIRLKMFNKPQMAPVNYDGQIFDAVFVGGGDTQTPTDTTYSGAIYMVKDKAVAGVAVQTPSSDIPEADQTCGSYPCFVDMTSATTSSALSLGLNGEASPTVSRKDALKNTTGGWVVRLDDGEKVVTDCQVYGGNLYVGTYYPSQVSGGGSSAACTAAGGYGRQMVMNAMTGMPLFSGTSLVNSAGNGRVYAGVYGMGRALAPVGTRGQPVSLGAPGAPNQQVSSTGAVRVYWYSAPER